MADQEPTVKDRIIAAHQAHPDWTAKQIAEYLGIERYHVYNNARAAGLTLAPAPPLPIRPPALAAPTPAQSTPVADFIVYANSPAEMANAQKSMLQWCDAKLAATVEEREAAQRDHDATVASGFSAKQWRRQIKLLEQKIDFYEKVKAALAAGYYIVPPFPIDVFAIRTTARTPYGGWTKRNWRTAHEQKERLLAAGEGRYVSPDPTVITDRFEEDDGKGGTKQVRYWKPGEFTAADFPFGLAKAEIVSATRAAMAMEVFDRMGVLPAVRAPDPIVCGQIMMPHRRRAPLTFFVAWWLDTRTL